MKEYIVVAHNEPDIDSLHNDLTVDTTNQRGVNQLTIPDRAVGVANYRLANPRITHYYLTDVEARDLARDPRVEAIHQPPNPDTRMHHVTQRSQAYNGILGNYTRNTQGDNYNINWGLRRSSLLKAEARTGNTYDYDVDGAGVDVVVMDDGIQIDHPEFLDATGVSRVQRLDWYAATGVPGTMPARHYDIKQSADSQGQHGTHVASTIAGKTFGPAKNARIYSLRVFGDSDQVIPESDLFDLIRIWHTKKPIDPKTGAKRPTIVNMSWGYAWYYADGYYSNVITAINYRGVLHRYNNPVAPQQQYGMQPGSSGIHCLKVPSVDAECLMMEQAGVIVVHSAGNYGNKIDVPTGKDYNNYYTTNTTYAGFIPAGQPIYYHRGGSPASTNAVTVSAAWHAPVYSGNNLLETLGYYSERGPGCDVIAPGSYITAATSKAAPLNYEFSPIGPYVFGKNNTTDTSHFVCKISGTSMAAPNVTGVLALYLSRNPKAKPADAKKWIQTNGIKNQVATTANDADWYNGTALLGAPNNYLYNPYHSGYKDSL